MTTDCIVWTGPTNHGYGWSRNGRVHRTEWEKHNGIIPPKMVVHHTCGNKPCYNIDHLELMADAAHKGLHGKLTRGTIKCKQHRHEDAYVWRGKSFCGPCMNARDRKRNRLPGRREYQRLRWLARKEAARASIS